MWELFEQYVLDTKKTPKFENILIQKTGDIVQVPRERPISFIGFENWLYTTERKTHRSLACGM